MSKSRFFTLRSEKNQAAPIFEGGLVTILAHLPNVLAGLAAEALDL